jgi:hypothetical protein
MVPARRDHGGLAHAEIMLSTIGLTPMAVEPME